jgi:hypothetical protein
MIPAQHETSQVRDNAGSSVNNDAHNKVSKAGISQQQSVKVSRQQ